MQRSCTQARNVIQRVLEGFEPLMDLFRVADDGQSGVGQENAAAVAVDEWLASFLLQFADLLGDRGDGIPQCLRGKSHSPQSGEIGKQEDPFGT